eukprot:Platyproteum_vivax@DN8520_c0_g1_i1.p1
MTEDKSPTFCKAPTASNDKENYYLCCCGIFNMLCPGMGVCCLTCYGFEEDKGTLCCIGALMAFTAAFLFGWIYAWIYSFFMYGAHFAFKKAAETAAKEPAPKAGAHEAGGNLEVVVEAPPVETVVAPPPPTYEEELAAAAVLDPVEPPIATVI